MKITLTQEEYLKTKLLFNATSKDLSTRLSLTFILLDSSNKCLIATNGHILRKEKFFDEERFSEVDSKQLISKTQFLLTSPQLKATYGLGGMIEIKVDTKLIEDNTYPDYERIVPSLESYKDKSTNKIGVSFDTLTDLIKTFTKTEQKNICFNFNGELGAVLVSKFNGEEKTYVEAGLLMPSRLFST